MDDRSGCDALKSKTGAALLQVGELMWCPLLPNPRASIIFSTSVGSPGEMIIMMTIILLWLKIGRLSMQDAHIALKCITLGAIRESVDSLCRDETDAPKA